MVGMDIPEEVVEAADEARVFIRYEDRYEFISAEGRIVAVMTPREFDIWKTRNPYRGSSGQ